MRKRGVRVILAITVILFALMSCSQAKVAGTAEAAPKEVITWKLQSWAPAGDPTFAAAMEFAEFVKIASDGRLVITPFNAGAIIPAGKEFDSVIAGSVEAIHGAPGWAIGYFAASVFYNNVVSGLTMNQTRTWLEHEGLALARKNYTPLGAFYVGPLTPHNAEVWAMSKKPIRSLADLKGYKMRLGNAALNDIMSRLGVTPVFLPGGEIYEAAQRGVIDGFEYVTPSVNWAMGYQEVTQYMYMSPSRAATDAQALFVNQKTWDALPADLQKIVEMAAFHVADRYFTKEVADDAEAMKKFAAFGTVIEKVPADIEAALAKAAIAYYDEQAAKDPAYKEIYESFKRWKLVCEQFDIK
jgi:TRAP-type mannitol/chloroaromatic compound transport system substrate-binding protein